MTDVSVSVLRMMSPSYTRTKSPGFFFFFSKQQLATRGAQVGLYLKPDGSFKVAVTDLTAVLLESTYASVIV